MSGFKERKPPVLDDIIEPGLIEKARPVLDDSQPLLWDEEELTTIPLDVDVDGDDVLLSIDDTIETEEVPLTPEVSSLEDDFDIGEPLVEQQVKGNTRETDASGITDAVSPASSGGDADITDRQPDAVAADERPVSTASEASPAAHPAEGSAAITQNVGPADQLPTEAVMPSTPGTGAEATAAPAMVDTGAMLNADDAAFSVEEDAPLQSVAETGPDTSPEEEALLDSPGDDGNNGVQQADTREAAVPDIPGPDAYPSVTPAEPDPLAEESAVLQAAGTPPPETGVCTPAAEDEPAARTIETTDAYRRMLMDREALTNKLVRSMMPEIELLLRKHISETLDRAFNEERPNPEDS